MASQSAPVPQSPDAVAAGAVAKGSFLIDCHDANLWRELRKPFKYV